MAKHEFGIMQEHPKPGYRYDEYEPERYNCIAVDDDYLEDIAQEFHHIDFYWHTLDMPGKGIAYAGNDGERSQHPYIYRFFTG